MSNIYTLRTLLNATFQSQTIHQILRRGAEAGCTYKIEKSKDREATWCNDDEATNYIMDTWREGKQKKDAYYYPTISILFNQEVWFDLSFKERYSSLALTLHLNRGWCKNNAYRIDFEKYIRLFLVLTQDFTVVWIKTYEELGDLDLYDEHEESYPRTRDYPELSLSPHFRVDVTLEGIDFGKYAKFDSTTLHNILLHGYGAGWKFFYQDKNVNIEEAIVAIFEQSPGGKEIASLTCSIDDMNYKISFTLRFNKFFMLTLRPLNTSLVPFRKTVEHALDLCTDFIIFELNTFDTRYNYVATESL